MYVVINVDRIIATVVLSKQRSIDMELPAFMPISELSTKVLETICVLYPDKWDNADEIRLLFMGHPLRNDTTLASNGVWDGAYLEVERGK